MALYKTILFAYNIGEILVLCLIGIGIVIAALAVLIVLLTFISKGVVALENKLDNRKKNKVAPVAVASPVSATAEDEETVAAITAALMAYYVQENRKCEFTIKRIKRIKRM